MIPSISRLQMACGVLHAERAWHGDALADDDAERRIRRIAAGDQHVRFFQRIADRLRGKPAVLRSEPLDTTHDSGVQGAHARRHTQSGDQMIACRRGMNWQSDRNGGFIGQRAGFGDRHANRLHSDESDRPIGTFGFDDGKAADGVRLLNNVGRRLVGDDDDRTLQRQERRSTRLRGNSSFDRSLSTPR